MEPSSGAGMTYQLLRSIAESPEWRKVSYSMRISDICDNGP